MIGIRCKLCKEFVGSVDRKTKMCERCGLKAENAELKKLLHLQGERIEEQSDLLTVEGVDYKIQQYEKQTVELKARWEELGCLLDNAEKRGIWKGKGIAHFRLLMKQLEQKKVK